MKSPEEIAEDLSNFWDWSQGEVEMVATAIKAERSRLPHPPVKCELPHTGVKIVWPTESEILEASGSHSSSWTYQMFQNGAMWMRSKIEKQGEAQ